jgi:hypothetical protein
LQNTCWSGFWADDGQSAPYCLFAPTGIAVPPRTAGFGKWQDWIAPAAGFHRIGGRIIAHRECASGCITLQPAPARFSIEVAQKPLFFVQFDEHLSDAHLAL